MNRRFCSSDYYSFAPPADATAPLLPRHYYRLLSSLLVPPPVEVPDYTSGEDAFARRMRMSQQGAIGYSAVAQLPPLPPPPLSPTPQQQLSQLAPTSINIRNHLPRPSFTNNLPPYRLSASPPLLPVLCQAHTLRARSTCLAVFPSGQSSFVKRLMENQG